MKSQIFKSAWNLVKINGMSFSEALRLSWKAFKNDVRIYVRETYQKVKLISFTKNGLHSDTLEKVIDSGDPVRIKYNPSIERYYGVGIYNND